MPTGHFTSAATAERPTLATDLDWLDLQIRTLFTHDERGRLTGWNGTQGNAAAAPAFFFARTRHGNLWRLREDLPDELVRELSRLAAGERTSDDLAAPPERLPAMLERIEAWAPVRQTWRGPAFRFPEVLPMEADGTTWLVGDELMRLAGGFPQLAEACREREPCAVVLEEGRVVSACYAATAPSPSGAVEAGVDTVAERRGQGLAAPLVVAWAREVRRRGGIPLYSTAWENRASRALARKLELIPFGGDLSLYVSDSRASTASTTEG